MKRLPVEGETGSVEGGAAEEQTSEVDVEGVSVAVVGVAEADAAEAGVAEEVAVGAGVVKVGSWGADSAVPGEELATDGLDSVDLDELRFLSLDDLRLGASAGVISGTA